MWACLLKCVRMRIHGKHYFILAWCQYVSFVTVRILACRCYDLSQSTAVLLMQHHRAAVLAVDSQSFYLSLDWLISSDSKIFTVTWESLKFEVKESQEERHNVLILNELTNIKKWFHLEKWHQIEFLMWVQHYYVVMWSPVKAEEKRKYTNYFSCRELNEINTTLMSFHCMWRYSLDPFLNKG